MSKNINVKNRLVRSAVAALLLAVILCTTLITTSCAGKFDYLKTDLQDYIEFTESYKDFKINVDIAKPHDIDVEVSIINMLYDDREKDPRYNGATVTSPITLTVGDVVDIWYRGYIKDENGEEIFVDGMCNFSGKTPASLALGSNGFVPGFELNLIGKNTGDMPKFEKITNGAITEDMIVYVSYSSTKGTDTSTKTTKSGVRIDLSGDVDTVYGAGVKDKILGMNIGDSLDFTANIGDASYTYTDFTVSFATTCEKNPVVIECYFPYDYSMATLRNETAYFEVYSEGVVVYDCPEFTDEYLQKKIEDGELNVTLDKLNEYEGDSLTDKYRDFAKKTMYELYESTYDSKVEAAVWEYLIKISKANKYPKKEVEKIYDDYVADLSAQFLANGGVITNNYGQSQTYETFDAYLQAYFGLSSKQSWKDIVYAECEAYVKERLVLFYILKAENLLPSDEEFKAEYDKIVKQYHDESIAQYLEYAGKTKDDYTEEEYKIVEENCLDLVFSNFDEDYFELRVYYSTFAKAAITWPEVSTLDDRRAYPLDK